MCNTFVRGNDLLFRHTYESDVPHRCDAPWRGLAQEQYLYRQEQKARKEIWSPAESMQQLLEIQYLEASEQIASNVASNVILSLQICDEPYTIEWREAMATVLML